MATTNLQSALEKIAQQGAEQGPIPCNGNSFGRFEFKGTAGWRMLHYHDTRDWRTRLLRAPDVHNDDSKAD
ncbi:MAG: hypothetical protein C9356_14955 [Oleiphilus sp.]|nr:MAG: hypothetical protein C9356_14955 [Oleiphilus sp.]